MFKRCKKKSKRLSCAEVLILLIILMCSQLSFKGIALANKYPRVRDVQHVCSNWPVPSGYVITEINVNSKNCNGLSEYTVTLPSDGMGICYNSPVPLPYVMISLALSNVCAQYDKGVIKHVAAGIAVCSTSPIPDGFVVTSSYADNATCRTLPMYRLSEAVNGLAMCNFSARPSGYVVKNVTSTNQCMGANAYVLQTVYEGVIACSFSRPPNGYVVASGQQTYNCTDGNLRGDYWKYIHVYDGVTVCPYSPIPVGYYVVSKALKSDCYGSTYGNVLRKG